MTTALAIAGLVLVSWITLRNPGYMERFDGWPTWWEWAIGAFGVLLICIAVMRVVWAVILSS